MNDDPCSLLNQLRQLTCKVQFMKQEMSSLRSQYQDESTQFSALMEKLVVFAASLSSEVGKFDLTNTKDDDRLWRYDILGKIGRGHLSTVFLCRRKSDKKMFVMKQYPPQHHKIVLSEMNLLLSHVSMNPHPCILQYVECFHFNDQICVILEDCNSEKLEWLIQKREHEAFLEDEILNWFIQIIEAEEYLQGLKLPFNYIFDVSSIYMTKSDGRRLVKLRIRPLGCCNSENGARINQLRFSYLCSILFQLVGLSTKRDLGENRSQVKKYSNGLLDLIEHLRKGEIKTLQELTEVDILQQKRNVNQLSTVGHQNFHFSDNYEHVATIGRGTFGRVTKVWHRKKRKQYAMKELLIQGAMDVDKSTEVEILRQVTHPYIVTLVEAFNNHLWNLCIVMEYLGGGNLHDRIKCQQGYIPFSNNQITKFFRPIAVALDFLHKKNYFHGDVKPQNILLTLRGDVKLGDFGCCRLLSQGASVMSTFLHIGTPLYMAPEIYSQLCFGKKADVWALGCLLYELVALEPAFNYEPVSLMSSKILAGEYLPLSNRRLSQNYEETIKSMLNPDPKKRPNLTEVLEMKSFSNDDSLDYMFMRVEKRDEWFDGLPPLIPLNTGMYPPVNWGVKEAQATSGEVWKSMVLNEQSTRFLKLSLLFYPYIIWCRFTRNRDSLWLESREVSHFMDNYLALDVQMEFILTNDELPLSVRKSAILPVDKFWEKIMRFSNLPWNVFNPNIAPTVCITLKDVEEMTPPLMTSIPQLKWKSLQIVRTNENGELPCLDLALLETGFENRIHWSHFVYGTQEGMNQILILPAIDVHVDTCNYTAMDLGIGRYENDLFITARYHPRTDKHIPQMSIQIKLLLTLMKHDGSQEEIDKEEVIILEPRPNQIMYFGPLQWNQYHPLIPPKLTLSMSKSLNQSPYWWRGLSPCISTNEGNSSLSIDWNHLPGAVNWKFNWMQMVRGRSFRNYLCLPTLVVRWKDNVYAIIFHLKRKGSFHEMDLCGGLHWNTPKDFLSITVKLHCQLTLTDENGRQYTETMDSGIIQLNRLAPGKRTEIHLSKLSSLCSLKWHELSLNTAPLAFIQVECINPHLYNRGLSGP